MLMRIYPTALKVGINPFNFWENSLDENLDIIEAYNANQKNEFKQRVILNDTLASVIGANVAKLFDSKNEVKIPQVWDYFPELFKEEKETFEEQRMEEEFESFKTNRKLYAKSYNEQLKGG